MVLMERVQKWDVMGYICSKMVVFVTTHRPDHMKKYIIKHANTIALKYVMDWLDAEGFRHCVMCPSRQQLRKAADGYVCINHSEKRSSTK